MTGEETDPRAGLTSLRAEFAVECIDLEEASGIEGAEWERFQLVLLNDVSQLSIWRKSRQVAWSFTVAAEAWIEAFLYQTSSIFVSISQDEAKEKIRYAKALYQATRLVDLPRLTRDNEFSLGFSNGAYIESLPSRAPRGKAKRNVYLDEFAHVAKDGEIYKGALPVISKGGRVRIGSSPFGARGLFWEIDTEALRSYPGYRRFSVAWWEVRAFCKNIPEARELAPAMLTGERVAKYGTDILKLLFDNLVLEDFQQEYECIYVDEVTSWITWDEIKRSLGDKLVCLKGEYTASNAIEAIQLIDQLAGLVRDQVVEFWLADGVDVGRTRNTTELYVGGQTTTDTYPLRLMITLDRVEFADQKSVIDHAVETLPIHTLFIDRNGLGMNLAEDLENKHPGIVKGFDFTNATKKVLASDAKKFFQLSRTPIPVDKDLAYQIHSIRRKVLASGVFAFDTEKAEKHHADKFWSHALMLHALGGRRGDSGTVTVLTVT